MKTIIVALLTLIANTSVAQGHNHGHDHHSAHTKKSTKKHKLNRQFVPTTDLKVRMEKLLALMKELNSKKEDTQSVKTYGDKITETVNDIFKTCKLEPEADEAIHPSLGLILDGASELKSGQYKSGHDKIHSALLNYEKLFKHDGGSSHDK